MATQLAIFNSLRDAIQPPNRIPDYLRAIELVEEAESIEAYLRMREMDNEALTDHERSQWIFRQNNIEIELSTLALRSNPFIARLPPEVLSMVFIRYVDVRGNPWILTRICQTWRYTAFDTAAIWSRIKIGWRKGSSKPRIVSGRQFCSTVSHLLDALSRSRGMPLDISIEDDWKEHRSRSNDSEFFQMLELLGGAGLRRWEHLEMTIVSGGMRALWSEMFKNREATLMNLRSLVLNGLEDSFLNLLNKTARNLEELSLVLRNSNEIHKLRLRHNLWLHSIRHLVLELRNGHIAVENLQPILVSCANLISLQIPGVGYEVNSQLRFSMPKTLLHLTLSIDGYIVYPLLAPSLTHLELTSCNHSYTIRTQAPVLLPYLNVLKITGLAGLLASTILKCPALEQLFMISVQVEEDQHTEFHRLITAINDEICILNPRHLDLEFFKVTSQLLEDLLFCLDKVEQISWAGDRLPDSLLHCARLFAESRGVFCPNLKSVKVSAWLMSNSVEYGTELEKVAKAKEAMGMSFKWVIGGLSG